MSVQLCRRQFIIPLALLAVITPFLFFSLSPSSLGPSRSGTGLHPHYPPPHAPFDASEPWRFVPARDARGALTHAQCDSAFPRLFEPLEAIVKARKGQLIKQKDVEIPQGACMLRVLIFDNEVSSVPRTKPENPKLIPWCLSVIRHRCRRSILLSYTPISRAHHGLPRWHLQSYNNIPRTRFQHRVRLDLCRHGQPEEKLHRRLDRDPQGG